MLPSLTLSSVLGVVVVLYLCTFLFFAVLRIITGVSIHRFGYLSIRGIRFTKRNVRFNIVRVGFVLHRPTFSQPTWISLIIRDSHILFGAANPDLNGHTKQRQLSGGEHSDQDILQNGGPRSAEDIRAFLDSGGDDLFRKHTKRQIEQTKVIVNRCRKLLDTLRRFVKWIKLVDIILNNTTIEVSGAGKIQIGVISASVATRKSMDESNSAPNACPETLDENHPFECILSMRSILLTADGRAPVLLSDTIGLSIGGVLEKKDQVLKDVTLDLKAGKLKIPLDDIACFQTNLQRKSKISYAQHKKNLSLSSMMGEMSLPGSRTERLVEIITESKDIFTSILGGVHEIQLAVAVLEISKVANDIRPSGKPLIARMTLKELGLDLHRLEQDSPAHRMDFSPEDIAHQALLAAISLAFRIDDQKGKVDQLFYVPMVTITSKTTLPSKTIQLAERAEADRNSNILNANIVVTSPSLDLEPRHLPIVVNLFRPKKDKRRQSGFSGPQQLISRLLPKANIKLSVHEPVLRVLLPQPGTIATHRTRLQDMLIYSVSSLSTEVESSHAAVDQSHYVLTTSMRVATQRLYYRAATGERHDLFHLETIELKAQLDASPEVRLAGTCYIGSCTTRMVRSEIVQGLKQMMRQFQRDIIPDKSPGESFDRRNFLRNLPQWLVQFKVDAKDFSIEVAGKDEEVSKHDIRGAAIQIESWSLDYTSQVLGKPREKSHPKRRTSRAIGIDEKVPLQSPRLSKNPTDGRKLSFHIHGLEGFMVESSETWDSDPMCALPHFELSLSANTDQDGPNLAVACHIKTVFAHYSLLRHYSILIAAQVLKDAFGDFHAVKQELTPMKGDTVKHLQQPTFDLLEVTDRPLKQPEFISLEIKVKHVKLKADFENGPKMMFEVYHLDTGRLRWGFPFIKARNVRVYVQSTKVKDCWARIISAKHFRGDMRHGRYEAQKAFAKRNSLDISMDAIRISVPHQVVLYKVTDNIINALKASKQLVHRFKSGTNEYILNKRPEEAKIIPRISIRTKALQLELEDDPFESKLALIYRVGLSEQKNRLAREEAFDAKVAKIIESKNRRHSMKGDTKSNANGNDIKSTQVKNEGADEDDSPSDIHGKRKMRYNVETAQGPSSDASISIDAAWRKLQEHNSEVWIRKMKWILPKTRAKIQALRRKFMGEDDLPDDVGEIEKILEIPARPGLMVASIVDFDLTLDKPSFPLSRLPHFLNRIGKGLPEDTKFSLLVPMSVRLNMGEARINLRDYPLPLLHIPQLKSAQSSKGSAWSLMTDFVIAEEFRDKASLRHVPVVIVPAETRDGKKHGGFSVDVHRTVSSVKTYSDIDISINTPYSTRVTWGTSYQPAIQDMMMVIETFTKPHADPSEKIGFWDKLRFSVHSRMRWAWKGDGDVQLTLKGSRDPYKITGHGAGFVKCWRGDVRCQIANDDKPLNFMIVESREYFLAVPDFSQQALESIEDASNSFEDDQSVSRSSSYKSFAIFKKVILKATGGVRWQLGLVFEQETSHEADWTQRSRSFAFVPHYSITLRSKEAAEAIKLGPNEKYDAFKGFRSHHIHLSISIIAPITHDWQSNKMAPAYNTIHLTPRVFTHFYDWWGLFSGVMSLPIRQGALFPGAEKSSKKFGRHLATIKYKLLLSPLYMSHIYKHKDAEEYKSESSTVGDTVTATGLKVKLHRFTLDAHQRKEESVMKLKGFNVDRRSTNMSIHQAEIDFLTADIRAVSATIASSTAEDIKDWTRQDVPINDNAAPLGDSSNFSISDGDTDWIDVDDFVELDWILPTRFSPSTKIMPLASTPRFTYFRQTEHSTDGTGTGKARNSPFGHEATHECVMSCNNDPREIQCGLIQSRLEKVNSQLRKNKELLDRLAENIAVDKQNQKLTKESERLIQQSSTLTDKIKFLQNLLKNLSKHLNEAVFDAELDENGSIDSSSDSGSIHFIDGTPLSHLHDDFNNRFIVHNMQAKWSNDLRNVILRYIHQVSQRRGFVYYMSRRAIKFILDLVEEQKLDKEKKKSEELQAENRNGIPGTRAGNNDSKDDDDPRSVQSRIEALLKDAHKMVTADDDRPRSRRLSISGTNIVQTDLRKGISEEYIPLSSYHVRLVAPQIQMQSDKNKDAALLVTSQSMQLTVISVMDKERLGDPVSGLVQRRFALELENAQAFVAKHKDFISPLHNLHSNNQYGCNSNTSWPPWVPLENMLLFNTNPHGFSRVVKKTTTTLRADKHNSLRLKLMDEGLDSGGSDLASTMLDSEPRVDHIWAIFDKVEVQCNSIEYFTLYIIVLDLLLYAEPLEKSRNEKLEKIMLASDFSDLSGAPDMIYSLQSRIQQLEEIKFAFQLNVKNLDKRGWQDRMVLEKDLVTCEDELFFMMKSIMSVQRKYDERHQTTGLMKWYLSAGEIVANLLRGKDQPFLDLKLTSPCYERTDNSDGSNDNTVEIEMLQGLNRLPDATYPNMLAPYLEENHGANKAHHNKILRVNWYMLEAIAGIPVMDHFEVNLFPLLIQLDRDTGEKLFEFLFPGIDANSSEGFSPFMVKPSVKSLPHDSSTDEDEEEEMLLDHLQTKMSEEESNGSRNISSSLENRLVPTITAETKPLYPATGKQRPKTAVNDSDGRTLKPINKFGIRRQQSFESLPSLAKKSAEGTPRNSTESNLRPLSPSFRRSQTSGADTHKKNGVWNRSANQAQPDGKGSKAEQKTDEISQMINRASNYMTLAYIKIPSVVLCLSYKGKGDRNLEDIHEFVFRMPTLEYRNKTWSNLDLLVRLKKDVIRALISHTGAIIEHKVFHRRPHHNKNHHIRSLIAGSTSTISGFLSSDSDLTSSYMTHSYDESVRSHFPGTSRNSGSPLARQSTRASSTNRAPSSARSSGSYSLHQDSSGQSSEDVSSSSRQSGHESEEKHGIFHNTLGRHLSILSSDRRARDGIAGESEESIRKKSRLLLGKKLLGNG